MITKTRPYKNRQEMRKTTKVENQHRFDDGEIDIYDYYECLTVNQPYGSPDRIKYMELLGAPDKH